jgi:hypothetical protein
LRVHGGRNHIVVGFIQSVPITIKVVSSNPAHGEVYLIPTNSNSPMK